MARLDRFDAKEQVRAGLDQGTTGRLLKALQGAAEPSLRALSERAPVYAVDQLLPPIICDWLLMQVGDKLRPARVYGRQSHYNVLDASRTNRCCGLPDSDEVLIKVRQRFASASRASIDRLEPTEVLHYRPGERFKRHFDFLDPNVPELASEIRSHGQRSHTILVYLNEDYDGGETEFVMLGLKHKGRKGDGVIFTNLTEEGEPDRRMLHAGLPPLAGEKWLAAQFVRTRPYGAGSAPVAATLRSLDL